jgi:hypothetical protein
VTVTGNTLRSSVFGGHPLVKVGSFQALVVASSPTDVSFLIPSTASTARISVDAGGVRPSAHGSRGHDAAKARPSRREHRDAAVTSGAPPRCPARSAWDDRGEPGPRAVAALVRPARARAHLRQRPGPAPRARGGSRRRARSRAKVTVALVLPPTLRPATTRPGVRSTLMARWQS